jgi:hypothetical protein
MIPRLTPKAAADIYGFSTGEALLKWCKRNDVPVDYLGRRALIPVASIEAAIQRSSKTRRNARSSRAFGPRRPTAGARRRGPFSSQEQV